MSLRALALMEALHLLAERTPDLVVLNDNQPLPDLAELVKQQDALVIQPHIVSFEPVRRSRKRRRNWSEP